VTGQPRERAAPRKDYRLPEARRAGAAAAEALRKDFGDAEWIAQAVDGLELYLQRCIQQFSATPHPTNNSPIQAGSDYREFARSAEEIKETMAAEDAAVSRAARVPRYRERPDEVPIPETEIADPMQRPAPPPAKPTSSWGL
jgi:hypothetical protein